VKSNGVGVGRSHTRFVFGFIIMTKGADASGHFFRKLLGEVREVLGLNHYAIRTEEAYVAWIRRFVLFHGKRHPREMGAAEVGVLLTDLATVGNVGVNTQQPLD